MKIDSMRVPPLRSAGLLLALLASAPATTQAVPALKNPRPRATPPTAPQPGDAAEPRPLDYQHPLGVGFDVPTGWQVAETAMGLQLTPPDASRSAYGPTEFYVVAMIGAEPSVQSLDDPRAGALLLQLAQSSLPFLQATGGAERVSGHDDLRAFTFCGRSPIGMDVQCRVTGKLVNGWFIALSAIAEPARLQQRAAACTEITARLSLHPAQGDPNLAGTWYAQSYSSTGPVSDRINVSTTTAITMTADGRLLSSTSSVVTGATGRHGGPGTSIAGQTAALQEDGRWARVGDDLWVVWKTGGANRYRLHVQGPPGRREMLLMPASGGDRTLWTEYRP
ncbi:MAG: hypothetical protein IPM29_06335 [Planctomycetes bacterium]|nr:hypothetical protein [Planctomycetota bacterium]